MHDPVMLAEVIKFLEPKNGETYIDATFGAGGYTKKILDSADCNVIAIDQDPSAVETAKQIKGNFKFVEGNFGNLENLISDKVDGIVFDIGVSSMQIDNAERGFSFKKDGPLDMRMSLSGQSAADFLNTANERDLANIIFKYGEEKQSRKIAKAIVANRPLQKTSELVEIIHKTIGNFGKTDSATKTFQAIRIHINNELKNLEQGLESALALLKKGGRLIIVTFHSLEDRIVKSFLVEKSGKTSSSNRHLPTIDSKIDSDLELITKKPALPSEEEIKNNPRARSAKLRAAIKISPKTTGVSS